MSMNRYEGSLLRANRTMVPLSIAVVMLLLSVEPVAAECNPSGADPSFRKAASFAARILIGNVVAVAPDDLNAADGASFRFTVAVERTLRGPATRTLVIDRVETGACVRWLSAKTGDRIALAMDVRASDPSVPTNTAGWLAGTPPDAYETVTLAEVLDLAKSPSPPDTSTGPGHRDASPFGPLAAVAVFAVAWLAAFGGLFRVAPAPKERRHDG